MIISATCNDESISRTTMHLFVVLLAIGSLVSIVDCLSLPYEYNSIFKRSEGADQQLKQKLVDDVKILTNGSKGLVPVPPQSMPIDSSMDKLKQEQHGDTGKMSQHDIKSPNNSTSEPAPYESLITRYISMKPNSKVPDTARIWKGLGLGAGLIG